MPVVIISHLKTVERVIVFLKHSKYKMANRKREKLWREEVEKILASYHLVESKEIRKNR